ncbi:MAG: hypothetical protein U1E53_23995 [Dongiaceae bacterium]
MTTTFLTRGWLRFPATPAVADWIAAARPAAAAALANPAHAGWWRHGDSWFVGVHALPNDAAGAVPGGPPLAGPAVDFLDRHLGAARPPWDRAQLSVCFPGYPRPVPGEPEGPFRYRLVRDAAHVDGLSGEGPPPRRRFLREPHAFLLGIPLVAVDAGMAPFVLWEGSHLVMREALGRALAGIAPARWPEVDLTEIYHAARREAFARCPRVEVTTAPGETYLCHRLLLHGMAPWRGGAEPAAGRPIVYFRPELARIEDWLDLP